MRTLKALILASIASGTCGTRGHEELQLIPIPARAASPETGPSRQSIRDYPSALSSIVLVFERDLGLPAVDATLVLFPTRRSFEEGLLQIGYPPRLARAASSFDAIGGAKAILVNGPAVGGFDWERRVRLLAHELVHTLQYQLGGGMRGASEQWLREGLADWIACRVMARLGFGSFESMRDPVLAPLAGVRLGAAAAPLRELSTFPQWVEAQRRYDLPLYALAFIAAELLVDTHGIATLIEYFERFATTEDRHAAFTASFGVDLPAFERQFQARWHQAVVRRRLQGSLPPEPHAPVHDDGDHSIPLNCSNVWPLSRNTSEAMNSPTFKTTATLTMAQPSTRWECS